MRFKYSAWYYKLLAWVLTAVCLGFGFFSAIITVTGLEHGYYTTTKIYQESWQCAEQVRYFGNDIIDQFRRNPSDEAWARLLEDSELRFIILNEDNGDVVTSYTEGMNLTVPDNMANNIYLQEYNGTMRLGEADSFLKHVYVMDYYFGYDADGRFWSGSNSAFEGAYNTVIDHIDGAYSVEVIPQVEEAAEREEESYQILYLLPQGSLSGSDDRIGAGYIVYQETRWWSGKTPWIFGGCAFDERLSW